MDQPINDFLSTYSEEVFTKTLKLREVLLASFPGIIEQVDIPAKMIAYCYGQKYAQLICTIIPSKKGLKLGFNRGTELPDPDKLLEGTGKMSRYVEIRNAEQINSPAMRKLIESALKAYQKRVTAQ